MRRREFIILLGSAAIPLSAYAQDSGRVWHIGILSVRSPDPADLKFYNVFLEALRSLGYVEGQNLRTDFRFAAGKNDLLPRLAAELVALKPDVIVTNGEPAIYAAQEAAGGTPIVMAVVGDPVAAGFARSLVRPGGNLTGLTNLAPDLGAKRLDFLREAVPSLHRVAVLRNPDNRRLDPVYWKECITAAAAMGLALQPVMLGSAGDSEAAFKAIVEQHADALLLLPDPSFGALPRRRELVELAAHYHLPASYDNREFAESGGLMSYGPNFVAMYRHAATYVDKILKGAKPGDLPIEQASEFELVINLKTAKALGLAIPQTLLLRADEVIE